MTRRSKRTASAAVAAAVGTEASEQGGGEATDAAKPETKPAASTTTPSSEHYAAASVATVAAAANNQKRTTTTTTTASHTSVQEQLETVLALMQARASGRATNDDVEAAVAGMLQGVGVVTGSPHEDSTTNTTTTNNKNGSKLPPKLNDRQLNHQHPQSSKVTHSSRILLQPDEENYDDDDDNDEEKVASDSQSDNLPLRKSSRKRRRSSNNSNEHDGDRSLPPSGTTTTAVAAPPPLPSFDPSPYQDIPLGVQGAQMLTTFGDGPQPHPSVVTATLLGARRRLQVAIQDARVLRRKQRQLYTAAKETLQGYKPHKPDPHLSPQWTPHLLYRALAGYDALAYDIKAGFEVDQLQQLFPEEMNAYRRWNDMHAETDAAAATKEEEEGGGGEIEDDVVVDAATEGEEGEEDDENDEDDNGKGAKSVRKQQEEEEEVAASAAHSNNDNDDNNNNNNNNMMNSAGGHLRERLAQFDVRTDRMKEDWYMKFADLRQGSFLPRRSHTSDKQEDARWEDSRDERRSSHAKERSHSGGSWRQLSLVAVRFLHWVGFDPQSALPPPTDDTTNALAFLAYDFFGRIVEKAIFLRNLERQKQSGQAVDETNIVLELEPGEQLELEDIERAMRDPDIQPTPLFRASTGDRTDQAPKIGPQLYFGPGFEERLEMELDELLLANAGEGHTLPLSPEELKIRQEEDALFARLAAPPEMGGVSSLLEMEMGPNAAISDGELKPAATEK